LAAITKRLLGTPLNAREAGAAADDTTDDAGAISATISAAATAGVPAYIPSGIYRIKSKIQIPSNATIVGDGRETVIHLDSADDWSGITAAFQNDDVVNGNTNITLRGLTFSVDSGVALSPSTYPRGVISFARVSGLRVENCYTKDYYGRTMFWLFGCQDVLFVGNDLESLLASGAGGCVWIYGGYDASHADPDWDSANIRIVGNSLKSKRDEPLAICAGYANVYRCTIAGNHLSNTHSRSDENIDTYAACFMGVDVTFGDEEVSDVSFVGNTVYAPVVFKSNTKRIVISGNTVEGRTGDLNGPIELDWTYSGGVNYGSKPDSISVVDNTVIIPVGNKNLCTGAAFTTNCIIDRNQIYYNGVAAHTATATPASLRWQQGMTVKNSDPDPGDYKEWICTTAGSSFTTWATGTAYSAADIVKPSVDNDHVYMAMNAGTSHGTTEPTWPSTTGETVSDNDITWKEYGDDAAVVWKGCGVIEA
jgi:hypothetical protein